MCKTYSLRAQRNLNSNWAGTVNLSNLKISGKLVAAFALILAVFVVDAGVLFMSLNTTLEMARKNNVSYQNSNDVNAVLQNAVEQQNAVRAFAATGDQKFLTNYAKYGAELDSHLAAFRARTTKAEQRARADAMREAVDEWRTQTETQVALLKDPTTADQGRAMVDVLRLAKVRDIQGETMTAQRALVTQRWGDQQKAIGQARLSLIVGTLAAVGVAGLMAWLLTRSIAAPVRAMTGTMGRLASGDNSVDVPALGRGDELGEMAKAVLAFKDAAIQKRALEGESAEQRQAAEAERARNEKAQAESAHQQAQVVEALAGGLSKMSSGDLTSRVDQAFAPEYEQLKRDFNATAESLQSTMRGIAESAGSMTSGAGEISTAADDLSRRTEQQAASLEETAAALDEITATVRRTSENATHARNVVGQAAKDAEVSGEVVRKAVAAMGEIEASAKQISQIIGVIDEIAFQTNLLALNAGVEAARAGDAGKGFAVVASEVRALAQRSAEAAKEIKALISTSSSQVEHGVALVGQAGEALKRITGQVATIDSLVATIAASAVEQSAGLNQVNIAVNGMDQVTQQNAAMVEESTAATQTLRREVEDLFAMIAQFKIEGEGGGQHRRAA